MAQTFKSSIVVDSTVTATTFIGALNGNASTATAFSGTRTVTLVGDVTGSTTTWTGSGALSITTTIAANSVALGTDTTGNYVAGATAGQGITITGTAGEGWSPTIALTALDLTLFPTSNYKKSVRVATTANITLSGTQTIDGIAVVAGNRVLVKNQTTASQNGIYVVAAGAWTRSTAADGSTEIDNAIVAVDEGTANGGFYFTNTFKTTDVVGTTAMPWYRVVHENGTWAISISGSAATLTNARTINGTSFNGSSNITTDNWGTARIINGVSVNGSTNYTLEPYVERDDTTNASRYLTFVDDSTAAHKRLNMDTNLIYNPSTNTLTAALSGNASTATSAATWTTARTLTIGATGKSVNGSANVSWSLAEIQAEYQVPNGTLVNNLGSPTVREAALFHGQFNNKFRFLAPTLQEESTDGTTWVTSTRASADALRDLMIGEGQGTSITAIPSATVGVYGGYRLTWNVTGSTGYVFLNALYIYNSTNGNTVTIRIEALHNTNGWTTIAGPSNTSSWPGHAYFPHNNIPYSTNASQYGQVRVTFSTTHNVNTNGFDLYAIEWFGGYPQGRRNVEYYDRDKNVTFPAAITGSRLISTVATGTAPFSVSSTTRVPNLNATTAGTADSFSGNRTVTLTGDVTGSTTTWNGSTTLTINTTIAANSVALGTDTTGNYVGDVTAGTGISIGGSAGEGTSRSIGLIAADLTLFPTSNFKKSVKAATTANITLSAAQTIDGIACAVGDRVLVKDQTTASQNGIYIVAAGAWTRSTAADGSTEIDNAIVAVDQGTTNGGQYYTNTFKTTDVVGTTAMPWYRIPIDSTGYTYAFGISGNAATATKLVTARAINGVNFDGTGPITITANTPQTLTRGTYLTGSNFNGGTATTWAVDATSANTASKVVARDASGNFSAGTITAALSGNASTATSAATWTTARNLTIGNTGKSVNGSANVSWSLAEIGALPAANGTVTGTLTISDGASIVYSDAGGTYVPRPAKAYYRTATAAHTGAIKITFPGDIPDDMMSFWVDIYDYDSNPEGESVSLYIYGYAYSNVAPYWTNVGALVLSDRTDRDYTVRFGWDGTNHCVTIGETTSAWNYPQINLRDLQAGYTAATSTFDNDLTITFVTTLPTIGQTSTANYVAAKTAQTLQTARTINGTSFNGSANITTDNWGTARTINGTSINGSTNYTTANWGTARTLTIGSTGKSVNGSENVSWTLAEIGALGATAKAADSELLDGVDSTRVIYGDNSTGTSYISAATLDTALKSGFYTTTGGVPNATSVNFVLHNAYYGLGNLAGFDLACNDSTTSSFYLRPATGGGKGSWQTIITSANIGSQSVSSATSAATLTTARTINGTSFNGSANITVEPYVERDDTSNAARYLTFVDSDSPFYHRLNMDNTLNYNPSTGFLTATSFVGGLVGNANTATTLATARTINGTSFNGSANITTASWGTSRNLTIGSATKAVDGSANVSFTLAEIGIAPGSASFPDLTNKDLGTGSYITNGDFRAPIFYDSTDALYYLHPNGFSNLSSGRFNSNLEVLGTLTYGAFSTGTNGYTRLPNGFIIQWARYTQTNDSTTTVSYPIAFPTAALAITISKGRTSTGVSTQTNAPAVSLNNNSTFWCNANDVGGTGYVSFIIAIGY